MKNIFTDNWSELPFLNEGDRLISIETDNPENYLYTIWENGETEEDFIDEVKYALRRKYGRSCYVGYEDATEFFYGED